MQHVQAPTVVTDDDAVNENDEDRTNDEEEYNEEWADNTNEEPEEPNHEPRSNYKRNNDEDNEESGKQSENYQSEDKEVSQDVCAHPKQQAEGRPCRANAGAGVMRLEPAMTSKRHNDNYVQFVQKGEKS